MQEEIYYQSLQTNQLQLSLKGRLSHYSIVLFLLFVSALMPITHLVKYIQGEGSSFENGEIWIVIVPLTLCILFYWLQKSRLKFNIVNAKLTHTELINLIETVSKKLEWHKVSATYKAFIAKTQPSFFSGSWGEQVTILFDKDRVLINSICDLDSRPSLVSFGRNRENVTTVKANLHSASHNDTCDTNN